MAFFQGLVPGHFAILQAKIGLKMAELDCFRNWLNLEHQQRRDWPGIQKAKPSETRPASRRQCTILPVSSLSGLSHSQHYTPQYQQSQDAWVLVSCIQIIPFKLKLSQIRVIMTIFFQKIIFWPSKYKTQRGNTAQSMGSMQLKTKLKFDC